MEVTASVVCYKQKKFSGIKSSNLECIILFKFIEQFETCRDLLDKCALFSCLSVFLFINLFVRLLSILASRR